MESRQTLSLDEIQKHNRPDDCWVAIEEKIWDVTEFLDIHPGGAEGRCPKSSVRTDIDER
jgi:L-lactate dehydrogenase (cytochrome)